MSFVLLLEKFAQTCSRNDFKISFRRKFQVSLVTQSMERHMIIFTSIIECFVVFGFLGNILVINSIARQRQLLKKNYYFLVLHLAVCDLGALIIQLLFLIAHHLSIKSYRGCNIPCVVHSFYQPFHIVGIGMMVMISVLRYRATVHPLKPAIRRVKLRKVCFFVYVVGSITNAGLGVPLCFNEKMNIPSYQKFIDGYDLFIVLTPVIFLTVCYCKIGRALAEQNKQMKHMGSSKVRNRHYRDRRICLVCLCTVLCFAVGRLLYLIGFIWGIVDNTFHSEHLMVTTTGNVLLIAGTHSANPLIYGILDKRMFTFLKLCRKKRQTLEELPLEEVQKTSST